MEMTRTATVRDLAVGACLAFVFSPRVGVAAATATAGERVRRGTYVFLPLGAGDGGRMGCGVLRIGEDGFGSWVEDLIVEVR
jgi:hypothetical protein